MHQTEGLHFNSVVFELVDENLKRQEGKGIASKLFSARNELLFPLLPLFVGSNSNTPILERILEFRNKDWLVALREFINNIISDIHDQDDNYITEKKKEIDELGRKVYSDLKVKYEKNFTEIHENLKTAPLKTLSNQSKGFGISIKKQDLSYGLIVNNLSNAIYNMDAENIMKQRLINLINNKY